MTSWSENPTTDDLTSAFKKGLGRVFIWAEIGKVTTQCLIDACLSDYRFDRQAEEARGDWLWQLILAAEQIEQLKEPILAAMASIENSGAGAQICQLARHFSVARDNRFRTQLQRIVTEKPTEEESNLGEEDLIRLSGAEGFLMAVSRHGSDLKARAWDWFDGALGDKGIQWLGDEFVFELLNSRAKHDDDIRRFSDAWLADRIRQANYKQDSFREKVKKYTAADIIGAAESPEKSFVFRVWGRYAATSDLSQIYERLLETTGVEELSRYLRVFAARPWPRFDERMLQFCLHNDSRIRRQATTAIVKNRHPEVRRFALEQLEDPKNQEHAIELLAANYESGDENRVLSALVLPDDLCDLHGTLMSLRSLIEDNHCANGKEVAELVYDATPCSLCRHAMVKWLSERIGLPESMRLECQFDVEGDTRALASGPSWSD